MKRIRLNRREREVYDNFVNTGGALIEIRRSCLVRADRRGAIRSLVYKGLVKCDFNMDEDYPRRPDGTLTKYYRVEVTGKQYGSASRAMLFDFNKYGEAVPLNRVYIKKWCSLCFFESHDPIGEYYGYNK